MQDPFDPEAAKKFLTEREELQKTEQETFRQLLLEKVTAILQAELQGSLTEAYLIGSVIQPFAFTIRSDVDIVLKNFHGDRFDFWTKMEEKIKHKVEIILFEQCHFQEFILQKGFKIV
jgi:hypothetical protein